MNELKWKWVYIPYLDAPEKQKESAIKAGYAKVYFKSEVDEVLAKKDEQIRRQKQQRYIAMARWCKDMADWWDYEQVNRLHEQHGNAESQRFKLAHAKFCYYVKKQELWQRLADELKPNDTTADKAKD